MGEMPFHRFGTMIDCSRNAVMKVESLKKWIDIIADLGYNTLLLYTEDTYEVEGNPYFGYLRGRYSAEELKEIDDYANSKGLECIPCIQTLAHLNAITRWNDYEPIIDTADILLVGDDRTYDLIDKMFASLSRTFRSKVINIGMDEAHMICRGKYYDLHGDCNRTEILIEHIKKVAELGKKYGLKLCMWSDMFYRLAAGDYYNYNLKTVGDGIKEAIPDNVELIYWDYYSTDKKRYNGMIKSHQKIKDGTWFAGGLWSWIGFAPHNGYSMESTKVALQCCRENGVKDVFLTMWGDNGSECSKFSLLPSLFYAAEVAKGNTKKSDIKKKFQEKFGISFDRFMLLDLLTGDERSNPEKYMLYNDLFMGIYDPLINESIEDGYAALTRKLGLLKKNEDWGYLFKSSQALCDVLSIKAGLGKRTRAAYDSKDKNALKELIKDYGKLIKKLEIFYNAYREQWYKENKGNGFDVQDIRLGGLIMRVKHCKLMLQDYVDGKLSKIDELEERLLPYDGKIEDTQTDTYLFNLWQNISTVNIL